jgi:hypothetical protein
MDANDYVTTDQYRGVRCPASHLYAVVYGDTIWLDFAATGVPAALRADYRKKHLV